MANGGCVLETFHQHCGRAFQVSIEDCQLVRHRRVADIVQSHFRSPAFFATEPNDGSRAASRLKLKVPKKFGWV